MAKIIIIDDELDVRENISAALTRAGHDVGSLDTTDDAVRNLVEDRPDLLILDVMFPDNPAAGFDLARRIRHTREIEDLPIVLLTSVNQELPMNFSTNDIDPDWMPVQDFVEKPVNHSILLEKIEKMLEKKQST